MWQGACVVGQCAWKGDMHSRGACMAWRGMCGGGCLAGGVHGGGGGLCMAGGHAWQEGIHGRGGMCGGDA